MRNWARSMEETFIRIALAEEGLPAAAKSTARSFSRWWEDVFVAAAMAEEGVSRPAVSAGRRGRPRMRPHNAVVCGGRA